MIPSITRDLFLYEGHLLNVRYPQSYTIGHDCIILDCAAQTFVFPTETHQKADEVVRAILAQTGPLPQHLDRDHDFYVRTFQHFEKDVYLVKPGRLVNLTAPMPYRDVFWRLPERLEAILNLYPDLGLFYCAGFQDQIDGVFRLPANSIVKLHEEKLRAYFHNLPLRDHVPAEAWNALCRYIFDGIDDLAIFADWWMQCAAKAENILESKEDNV